MSGELEVKYAMIRSMLEIKDQIKQRDEAIPLLQRQLSDARGERLELIGRLDAMERFSEDHEIGITAKDLEPVVNAESPRRKSPFARDIDPNDF